MNGVGDFGHEQRAAVNRQVPLQAGGRRPRQRTAPPRLFLATTGSFLDSDEIRADSVVMQVVADDIAWRFSVEDWQARRPPRWAFRRLRRWHEEFLILANERDQVARTAQFFGVPD